MSIKFITLFFTYVLYFLILKISLVFGTLLLISTKLSKLFNQKFLIESVIPIYLAHFSIKSNISHFLHIFNKKYHIFYIYITIKYHISYNAYKLFIKFINNF